MLCQELIAKGALRADQLTRTLVPALLEKSAKLMRNKTKRTGTSDIDPAGVQELGFLLGSRLKNPEVQRAFGIGRAASRFHVNFHSSDLPFFFGASDEVLIDGCNKAVNALGLEGQSQYMLVRDEVVFSRTWSLVYGLLEDPCRGAVVGGRIPEHMVPSRNFENEEEPTILDPSLLADVTCCTILKHVDRAGGVCVQMLPRSHKVSAADEFESMGHVLQGCDLLTLITVYRFYSFLLYLICTCVTGVFVFLASHIFTYIKVFQVVLRC